MTIQALKNRQIFSKKKVLIMAHIKVANPYGIITKMKEIDSKEMLSCQIPSIKERGDQMIAPICKTSI